MFTEILPGFSVVGVKDQKKKEKKKQGRGGDKNEHVANGDGNTTEGNSQ